MTEWIASCDPCTYVIIYTVVQCIILTYLHSELNCCYIIWTDTMRNIMLKVFLGVVEDNNDCYRRKKQNTAYTICKIATTRRVAAYETKINNCNRDKLKLRRDRNDDA